MDDNLIEEVKIISEENDLLGTYSKAKSICDFLELEENKKLLSKNNLIAIYGPWGIGKSCLMKTIQENLDSKKFKTLWFDTWKYEKDDNLPYSLFKFIGKGTFWNKLLDKGGNIISVVYGMFKSMTKGVEIELDAKEFKAILKPGDFLDEAENQLEEVNKNIEEDTCLWEKIDEFENIFKNIKFDEKKKDRRLVVFLDDLDRCESENIITLISSIKLLLSINPNIIFIMGIDREAITLALQNKYNNDYNKSNEYLEKIFPVTFEITSKMQNKNLKKYISDILKISEEDSEFIIEFFKSINFNNLRHIKKVFRKYYIIKEYLISKQYDLNNKYNITFVLYNIIINFFYNDEYQYLSLEDKYKIYESIILVNWSGEKELKNNFLRFRKTCNFSFKDNCMLNIYELLIRFSSYKLTKNEIRIYKTLDGSANFNKSDWMMLFENNICKMFIEFVIKNKEFLNYFFDENKEYKNEYIFNFIKEINDII